MDREENRGFAASRARWVRAAFGASRAVRVPPDRGALSGRWDREVRRACAVTPGPKGDPGPQGPIGPRGERGEKGKQGIQDEKGDTGETPVITVA